VKSPERYGSTAIGFHWATLVLVVIVGILGLLHDSWSKQTQGFWINVHAMLGLALWLLVWLRLWWRKKNAPPVLPETVGAFSRRIASLMHWMLYALMIVTPVLGIITFIYHGRVFDFGVFQLDTGIKKDRTIFHPTEDIHGYLAYALFALASVHALAVLWHHLWLRDEMLWRMWPR